MGDDTAYEELYKRLNGSGLESYGETSFVREKARKMASENFNTPENLSLKEVERLYTHMGLPFYEEDEADLLRSLSKIYNGSWTYAEKREAESLWRLFVCDRKLEDPRLGRIRTGDARTDLIDLMVLDVRTSASYKEIEECYDGSDGETFEEFERQWVAERVDDFVEYVFKPALEDGSIEAWRKVRIAEGEEPVIAGTSDQIGYCWAWDTRNTEEYLLQYGPQEGVDWIMKAHLPIDSVDWYATLGQNIDPTHEEEKEIQLRDDELIEVEDCRLLNSCENSPGLSVRG